MNKRLLFTAVAIFGYVLFGLAQTLKMPYPEPALMPTPIESTSPPVWGYFNLTQEGKFHLQIPYKFQQAELFNRNIGLAKVRYQDQYGFIDSSGEFKIPPVYDEARGFDEDGYCVVSQFGKEGVINAFGDIIIPLEYDGLENLYNGWYELYEDGEFIGFKRLSDGRFTDSYNEYLELRSKEQ